VNGALLSSWSARSSLHHEAAVELYQKAKLGWRFRTVFVPNLLMSYIEANQLHNDTDSVRVAAASTVFTFLTKANFAADNMSDDTVLRLSWIDAMLNQTSAWGNEVPKRVLKVTESELAFDIPKQYHIHINTYILINE
jgi:hypothetical protein